MITENKKCNLTIHNGPWLCVSLNFSCWQLNQFHFIHYFRRFCLTFLSCGIIPYFSVDAWTTYYYRFNSHWEYLNFEIYSRWGNSSQMLNQCTFNLWEALAPFLRSNSTTETCPPAHANDKTVWSLLTVALLTSAPGQFTQWITISLQLLVHNNHVK